MPKYDFTAKSYEDAIEYSIRRVEAELQQVMEELQADIQLELNANGNIATGKLYNSVMVMEEVSIRLKLRRTLRKIFGLSEPRNLLVYMLPYWKYVERGTGRRAGHAPYKRMPPKAAMVQYVTAKYGVTGKESYRAAYMLGRHIYLHGTKSYHFLQKAVNRLASRYGSEVRESIKVR